MKTLKLAVMIFLSFVFCAGCAGVNTAGYSPAGSYAMKKPLRQGLPLQAPGHVDRYQQQPGVTLEFDTRLGVYTVLESPGTYFNDGLYYRVGSTGQCVVASDLNGPWRFAAEKEVPERLAQVKGNNRDWIW
jgi:hypothetical protein